jgi:hypothetical protein
MAASSKPRKNILPRLSFCVLCETFAPFAFWLSAPAFNELSAAALHPACRAPVPVALQPGRAR